MFFQKKDINSKLLNAQLFDVSFDQGLNDAQVQQRQKEGLVNKNKNSNIKSYYQIIFKNIFNFLNIVFFIIVVFLLKFKLYRRLHFLLAFLPNIFINLLTDIKIRRVIGKISLISNQQIIVIRNGVAKKVFSDELVFSDVILLKNKDIVPCDSEVIHGNVFVNESFLTGESDDINKSIGSKLLAKSVVVNGTCYAKITNVAQTSYILQVQKKLHSFSRPKSQIINFLNKIIFVNTFLAFFLNFFKIVFLYKKYGFNFPVGKIDSITSSLLSMLSVGMYLMISIILTLTVINLYIQNDVLVNEPFSIETLSESNVFCFDKTGTLTTGEMEVQKVIPIGNMNMEKLKEIICQVIYVNKDENLTAKALKKFFLTSQKSFYFEKNGYLNIPFNSKNKYSAISYNGHTYLLGAYDFVNVRNQDVKNLIVEYEKKGFRVLVVAQNDKSIVDRQIIGNFDVIGVLILAETIRENFTDKISEFKNKNNVDMFIISGDSEHFLNAIAKKINFNGKTISLRNSNIAIKDAVKEYKIFARVTPEQKKEIVNELQKQGKIVSMMGDGINDLLALKSADCSIAIPNNDNNIVKSISHITLFNSDFSNFEKVIETSVKIINKIKLICSTFLIKAIFALFLNYIFFILNVDFPYRVNNFFAWEYIGIAAAPFFIIFLEKKHNKTKGSFVQNMITEIIPAVLTQLLACLLVFIFYQNKNELIISLSTILISFMSVVFLIHICYPLNMIHYLVFTFSFISMFSLFLIDYWFVSYWFGYSYFGIYYNVFNKKLLLSLLFLFIILNIFYFLIMKIWNKIVNFLFFKKDYSQETKISSK